MGSFSVEDFLPASLLAEVTDRRVTDPEFSFRAAASRKKRAVLVRGGRLNILAADHPARNVTKVGDDPLAMTDRQGYLARILRILACETVDGIMATMDVLEDLLAIGAMIQKAGGPSILDERVMIASLNRGGLAGACWELDDPITGPSPATCVAWNLDGAKILLRVVNDDPGALRTLVATAGAITEANALRLPTFLEPLPVVKSAGGYATAKERALLARLVGVASALGDSSRYLWLKLPYCQGFESVARATTLPILLLGGESAGDPAPFLRQLDAGLDAGPNVRGALVGRNVLYPGGEDPLVVAAAAGGIIHHGWSIEQALELSAEQRGRDMDYLTRWM